MREFVTREEAKDQEFRPAMEGDTLLAKSEKPLDDEIRCLQTALRSFFAWRQRAEKAVKPADLEGAEESDSVSIVTLDEIGQCFLSQEAKEKREKLPPFSYSMLVEEGDTQASTFLSNGCLYSGQWKDGKQHGKGVCYTLNGEILEGYWSNGLHIKGRVIYSKGDMYEGDFVRSRREGKGKWESADGSHWYEGAWRADLKYGFGVQQLADGLYEGSFANDYRHGKGKFVWASGEVYEGDFVENRKEGIGRLKNAVGDILFEGEWLAGIDQRVGLQQHEDQLYKTFLDADYKNGRGRFVWASGEEYEGDFVKNQKEGKGRLLLPGGNGSYDGEWLADKKHGFGVEQMADGSRYEGFFSDDEKNGRGKFVRGSGEMYEGDFKDNMMHGQGKYVWNAEKWYEGEWFEGRMHGKGHMVQDGKDYTGEFVKDKKQGHGILKWDGNVYEGDFFDNKMHGKGLLSQKGKPAKLYAFEKNKRGARIEDPPAS